MFGWLTQSVECLVDNQKVIRSNRVLPTLIILGPLAHDGRAFRLHRKGGGFDSRTVLGQE